MRTGRLALLTLAALAALAAPPPACAEDAAPVSVRGPRIPGTRLRLGDSLAIVRGRPELRAVSDPELDPGELAYAGTVRFYGADGATKLVFHGGRLVRATFTLKPASPRARAYVEDDLRRLGYRSDCRRTGVNDRDCDWSGPLAARVRTDTLQLRAEFRAPGTAAAAGGAADDGGGARPSSGVNLPAILASDTTAILPDTLDIREDHPAGHARPVIQKGAIARIPDDLRGSVERGLITVLAFVDAEGRVAYATAVSGPEELRPIAEGAAMEYKFQRYVTKEGRRRFWVRISIYPA